ncbi:bifunctional DNA primase/polymerase [Natrinema sp. HArc-T2]|uniref:bifunctional DNA primase/polymerase n=1 Tax=Natrinema sp. HArc-T2 TaxID=3242701 RepID=UPI00359CD862
MSGHDNSNDVKDYNKSNAESNQTAGSDPKEVLESRLREAGLDAKRFIPLQEGSKAPVAHTQYEHHTVDGQYGVYAGGGLVIVDYDPYKVSERPNLIERLPSTLTVESPHDGRHYYLSVEDDVGNGDFDGGSIQASRKYVVGPGSELDSCDKEWHDCSPDIEGHYCILHNRPIASVSATVFPDQQGNTHAHTTDANVTNISEEITDLAEVEAPFDVERRIQMLLDSDVGETVRYLMDGEYNEVGYCGDRSGAETKLCTYLKFALNNNHQTVKQVMDWICYKYPKTACGKPRKWAVNEYHRRSALSSKYDPDDTYDEPMPTAGPRPKVSQVAYLDVLDAIMVLGSASSAEISQHKLVDVGQRQVQNALNELEEDGLVTWEREGRSVIYKPISFEELA